MICPLFNYFFYNNGYCRDSVPVFLRKTAMVRKIDDKERKIIWCLSFTCLVDKIKGLSEKSKCYSSSIRQLF